MIKKRLSIDTRYRLNAVCPYYTMFPLEFPYSILRKKKKNIIALDPFCGRGTTNFAARVTGHVSYGIDASPVAVAISRAKIAFTTFERVMTLLEHLLESTTNYEVPQGAFWNWAFHPETLDQISRLRAGLIRFGDSDDAAMLTALMLGCLHGPLPKDSKNSGYFSNQMPRTFSSKPDYSVRYWQEHKMNPIKVCIIGPLRKKAKLVFAKSFLPCGEKSRIFFGDSSDPSIFERISDPVDLVITSPPYYGMRSYVQDQWLRFWFLGGPDQVSYNYSNHLSHLSPENFSRSLSHVWNNAATVANQNIRMVIRFGALPSRKADSDKILRDSLQFSKAPWEIYRIRQVGDADLGRRQSLGMGEKASSKAVTERDYYIRLKV